jgi:hypothetical protein
MGQGGLGKFVFFLLFVALGLYINMANKAVKKKEAFYENEYLRGRISLEEYLYQEEQIELFDMLFYPNEVFELGR